MKGLLALVVPSVFFACVTLPVVAPPEPLTIAPVGTVSTEPLPPPDAPRDLAELPAGPGVTLLVDQLHALVSERKITNHSLTFEERVAIAEKALGVRGEPMTDAVFDGVAFRAVSGRSLVAPFGCHELVISRKGGLSWSLRTTNHRHCGLPYVTDASKPYSGPAPKRTAFRLEEALASFGLLSPVDAELRARSKLGPPDFSVNGESAWAGLGARGKDAPISCRLLHLGGRPRIEDVALSYCMLAWPMPGMTFDPGPEQPAIDKKAKLAECAAKCGKSEVCMLEQRLPSTASMRTEADGLRARYPDGRAAHAEMTASCAPIPSSCTILHNACFFPVPPTPYSAGPCPKTSSFGSLMTSSPAHIMCYARYPSTPLTVAVPRTVAPPRPPTASSSRVQRF